MKFQPFSRLSVLILLILFSIAGNALAAETWVVDPNTGTKIGWSSTDWVLLKASWNGPAVGGKAEGKGEKEPVADNKTKAGQAKNRRVEVVVRGTRPAPAAKK